MLGVGAIGVAAKKKSLHASERETERVVKMRSEYEAEVLPIVLERLKFLDEAGSNVAMTRLYGRAQPGQRVVESVPQNYGENVSMLAAISMAGVSAPMTISGAVDGLVFLEYVKQVLCPSLAEGDVIVMDNLSAHKIAGVRQAIEAEGAKLLYLPPYSPDLNPIEKCWSKIKTYLRKAKARTYETLTAALKEALLTITTADIKGWFASCGYSLH